jgi:hypothetical protein
MVEMLVGLRVLLMKGGDRVVCGVERERGGGARMSTASDAGEVARMCAACSVLVLQEVTRMCAE